MVDVRIKKVTFGKYQIWNDDVYYTLKNVHNPELCAEMPCVIHNPTEHHLRSRFLLWREDRAIFERICEHGVGHYDPDQEQFWRDTNQTWQMVHGCCENRCCLAKEE